MSRERGREREREKSRERERVEKGREGTPNKLMDGSASMSAHNSSKTKRRLFKLSSIHTCLGLAQGHRGMCHIYLQNPSKGSGELVRLEPKVGTMGPLYGRV